MIKTMIFVQRKPGFPRDKFREYALYHHAQLIRDCPEKIRPVRYCQNHVYDGLYADLSKEHLQKENSLFNRDSVVEIWRKDLSSNREFACSEYGSTVIPEDERKFANTKTTLAIVTSELDQNGQPVETTISPESFKCFLVFGKIPGMPFGTFWNSLITGIGKMLNCFPEMRNTLNKVVYCKAMQIAETHRTAHDDLSEISACVVFFFDTKENSSIIRNYWNALLEMQTKSPFFNVRNSFWLAAEETVIIG